MESKLWLLSRVEGSPNEEGLRPSRKLGIVMENSMDLAAHKLGYRLEITSTEAHKLEWAFFHDENSQPYSLEELPLINGKLINFINSQPPTT